MTPSSVAVLAVAAEPVVHGVFSPVAMAIGAVLLVLNGAFTAAEIALLATRRGRIEEAAEAGDRRAQRAMKALTDLRMTFTGAQLGITMSSIGLGVVAEPAVEALIARWIGATPLPPGAVPAVSFGVALAVVVFLHMVVGDMAPKNLAITRPEQVTLRLARPFGVWVALTRPLLRILNGATRLLVRLVRVEPVDERKLVHTPEELVLVLAESRQLGTIEAQDARVMGAALRLGSIDAEAAMTPRVDLAAVADTTSLADVLEVARDTGHTRVPVYHDDIDHIVGVVHVKDVLIREDEELERLAVSDLLRPIPAVPESRDLEQLLRDMLEDRSHAVLVVDEHGGTAGLLTLEDVLEELVGEIDDEFDAEAHPHRASEQVWLVPGTMRRDEVERLTGIELGEGGAETVSGVLVERLGRLLERGDRVVIDGWELTVLSLDGRRAGEVEVRRPAGVATGGDPDDGATGTGASGDPD